MCRLSLSSNVHSPINCLQPSIVLNSKYIQLLRAGFRVYLIFHSDEKGFRKFIYTKDSFTDEGEFLKLFISIKNKYVNENNIYSNFYFERNGVKFPLYYLFACGHCELCRAKKSNEYSFRASCETYTYPDNPLFVTLTYSPKYLPSDGLELSHLQNFFKRLRFRLKEYGYPTDFRYLAVGEYGGKFGRPHYHIIFWNLPLSSVSDTQRVYSFIRFAWSTYRLDSDDKRVFVKARRGRLKGKDIAVRDLIGYAKILPVTTGCPAYITKYFRKEQHNIKSYPNKGFLVSSRGEGGIGSKYIDSYRNFFMNKPTIPQLSVLDPISNKISTFPLTGYLKRRLFPSLSGVYGKARVDSISYYDLCVKASSKLDLIFAYKHHLSSLDYSHSYKPYNWDLVRLFLKHSRHFFRHKSPAYYYSNYSYLRHLSSDDLLYSLSVSIDEFNSLVRKLDFSLLDKLNILYLQSKAIRDLQNKDSRVYYYNIPANILNLSDAHSRYLTKCIF